MVDDSSLRNCNFSSHMLSTFCVVWKPAPPNKNILDTKTLTTARAVTTDISGRCYLDSRMHPTVTRKSSQQQIVITPESGI